MKKLATVIILAFLTLFAVLWFTVFNKANVFYTPKQELTEQQINDAFSLLYDSYNASLKEEEKKFSYIDFLKTVTIDSSLGTIDAVLTNEDKVQNSNYNGDYFPLDPDLTATYEVDVDRAGFYYLELDYLSDNDSLNDVTLSVSVNDVIQFDESKVINIPLKWKDRTKQFSLDSYGDETLPTQEKIKNWNSIYLYNNTYYTVEPLFFEFNVGVNTISIENISSQAIKVGNLTLVAPENLPTYSEYKKDAPSMGEFNEFIDAISYVEKNSSYVRMSAIKEPTLTPFHPVDKKLNVIDGISWKKSGQELVYEINVPTTGNYRLGFYYQNTKNDFSVFRTIRIDGKIPFEELKAYEFEVTKNNKWELEVLSDQNGNPYDIYLESGKHTLSFTAEAEPVTESVRNIQLILDHINKFSLDIIKITGKEIDKNRTWNIVKWIPETDRYLEAYEILIKDMITDLSVYADNKEASSSLSYLQKALYKLNDLREYPGKLPIYLEDLSGGSNSVAQMLGDSIRTLNEQPLSLDGFYVFNTEKIEAPKASFFKKLSANLSSFISSFTSSKYSPTRDPEVVDVWVSRPITYVDIMQKMVDSEFTPQTGIKVKISVMPDANKLILASAANQSPDVALGLASYMPFEFAIRNAAYDLAQFDDFWYVAGEFAPGSYTPYILNDGVYAMPETLDFNAIIYRKDTFNSLNLEVPDTWKEVIEILPELQRWGKNFYHPIAGGGALKWFYQTSSLIYQYNGDIYSKDGLSTAIDTENSVRALTDLNKLFTTYSLPEQVGSFYNEFRYNELPIGIVDFNTYLQIKNAAPELIGQWGLAAYPGTEQEDGTINRSYIANGSAGIILNNTDRAADSWKFMKWWMSAKSQTTFSQTLQSTYGPEFVWLSGNLEAVKGSPIENQDLEVILEQVKWLQDVPRTPGQYMLERGLSDIWNTAVFDNTPTGVAIDKQVIVINREIKRKMIEFGYIDSQGNVVEPYIIRDVKWIKEQMEKARK